MQFNETMDNCGFKCCQLFSSNHGSRIFQLMFLLLDGLINCSKKVRILTTIRDFIGYHCSLQVSTSSIWCKSTTKSILKYFCNGSPIYILPFIIKQHVDKCVSHTLGAGDEHTGELLSVLVMLVSHTLGGYQNTHVYSSPLYWLSDLKYLPSFLFTS